MAAAGRLEESANSGERAANWQIYRETIVRFGVLSTNLHASQPAQHSVTQMCSHCLHNTGPVHIVMRIDT